MGVITLGALAVLPNLHTEYSLKQFLPLNNALLKQEEQSRETFQLSELQPFVIIAKLNDHSTWYDKSKIHALKKITLALALLPGVSETLSLATIQGVQNNHNELSIGPLLEHTPEDRWPFDIPKNPLVAPNFISADGTIASIVVQVKSGTTSDLKFLRQELTIKSKAVLPFAEISLGGTPAVQADINVLLESEIRNFILLSLVVCFITLGFVFANTSPLFISFIIVICTNILVLATMAMAGYSLSILSSTIPILTTVDVMSLCLHTLLRYAEEQKAHPSLDHEKLVIQTLRAIIRPNLIASLTTMIGFLTLVFTDVPIIKDYGWTAAFSIIMGWVTTTILLYPLMMLLPGAKARQWAWSKARWGLHLLKHSKAWLLLIVIFSVTLGFKGQHLSWSARLFDDLPEDHPARLSTELIDQKLGGMIPIDMTLQGSQDFWNHPQVIRKLNLLIQELRQSKSVGSIIGLPELIMAIQNQQDQSHFLESITEGSISETYFLYSLSNTNPLRQFLNGDNSSTRISMRIQDLPGDQIENLTIKFQETALKYFPEVKTSITGMGSAVHQLNNELSKELIFGFWQSMMFIAFMLVIVFKSLRWSLIACIPNLVPPAVLMGFLSFTRTPIKPSVAIIFSIALGLAFNNTVYLLERLRSLQQKKRSPKLEIKKVLWIEGNPCLISSLILLMGFSVFMASYFSMNRIFGFYMLLSMIAGLLGDLVLLPTLLKAFPWLLTSKDKTKKESAMPFNPAHVTLLIIALIPTLSWANPMEPIIKEMNSRFTTQDEDFIAQMRIIESDGSSKIRGMHISRMSPNKKEHLLMVRMESPTDLKGTAILATLKEDQEDKWIYLPSSKQTRRLTGDKQQGGILGSEISTEDFEFNHERSASSILTKTIEVLGKTYYVIEIDVNQTSPNYSKIISYVSTSNYTPIKSECFDKKGQILKVIDFSDYKKTSQNKWRPGKIKVKNMQNKRSTEITMEQIKLNQNLKASKFTAKALAND